MPREPFRPVELSEALRPVASPVDTFVHAQEPPRDNNLQDLARSLSGLGGSLAGLVGKRDAQAEEDDKIRARADFWRSNGTGAAEGIKQGIIPAQASPAYLRAWKETEGSVAGGMLQDKVAAAYDAWPDKTSTDPEAINGFLGKFFKDNIQTTDVDVLRGLLPHVEQIRNNYLHRQIGDASKATAQGLLQSSAAQDSQALEAANTAGLASRKGTDYEAVFRSIEANREAKLKVGANVQDYDRQVVVDGITAAAVQLRDPKILTFLDRKVPGTDYAWSNTPYGREQRQKTLDTLERMGRTSISDDEKRRREEKAEAKDTITRDTIAAITKDPRAPIPEELLSRGEKVDPDFRINAIRWRDTIGKQGQSSDPKDLLAVTSDVLNGGGLQRVQRAMREGVFKNAEDLTRAYKLAEGMKTDGPKLDAITKLQSFKELTATIKVRTAGKKDLTATFDDGSFSAEGMQAMADLRLQVLQWAQQNPEAGPIEQEEAVAKFGADMLKRLPTTDAIDVPFYNREGIETANAFGARGEAKQLPSEGQGGGITKANPVQPTPRAEPSRPTGFVDFGGQVPGELSAPPSAPAPSSTAHAPPQAAQPEAVSAWLNGLPLEMRGRLEMRAAEERKPLLLKAQEVYQRGVASGDIKPAAPAIASPPAPAQPPAAPGRQSSLRAPDGTPIETASAVQGDGYEGDRQAIAAAFAQALGDTRRRPVGGYVSAQLRGDPQAARILDFVAGPESGGNYNAFFGNGRSTRDLSAMTLDQVMAWSRDRGTASSATGRYQFMRDTLRGLKQEMGLSGSERFTPELQDRLALQLLERRGYSDWKAGRLTDAQFANRLALEWASLPSITAQNGRPAGVSAYAGDGLNRSLVSPAAVLGALRGRGGSAEPGFIGRLLGRRAKPTGRPDDGDGQTRT